MRAARAARRSCRLHGALGPPVQSDRARWTVRIIGIAAAVGVAATVWLGLWVTPPDQTQGNTVPGDLVRLVYIHPGVAWVALYLAFGLAAVASLLYLWPRTRSMFWDRLAAAAVEVGRGVQRVHAHLGVDLGQADLGRVLGVGCPADPHRGAAGALPRVHGSAPGTRRAGEAGQAQRLRRPVRRRRHSPRPLLRPVVEDAPSGCDRAQPRPLAHHPRVDGLDAAAQLHRPDPGLRVDAAGALPDRRARGLVGEQRAGGGPP